MRDELLISPAATRMAGSAFDEESADAAERGVSDKRGAIIGEALSSAGPALAATLLAPGMAPSLSERGDGSRRRSKFQ